MQCGEARVHRAQATRWRRSRTSDGRVVGQRRRARGSSAGPARLEPGARGRGRRRARRRARSPGLAGALTLKSPPRTSGRAARPSAARVARAARGPRCAPRPASAPGVEVAPPTRRSSSRTACTTRRSGRRRSRGCACSAIAAPRTRIALAPPPLDLITSGQRSATHAAQRQQRVARRQRACAASRRARARAARGHHGGTSCSSATSQSQPASVARELVRAGRVPRGGTARPWKRFQVRTRMRHARVCCSRLPRHFLTGDRARARRAARAARPRARAEGRAALARARWRAGTSR